MRDLNYFFQIIERQNIHFQKLIESNFYGDICLKLKDLKKRLIEQRDSYYQALLQLTNIDYKTFCIVEYEKALKHINYCNYYCLFLRLNKANPLKRYLYQPFKNVLLIVNNFYPISRIINLIVSNLAAGNKLFVILPNDLSDRLKNFIKHLFAGFDEHYIYFCEEMLDEKLYNILYEMKFDYVFYDGKLKNKPFLLKNFSSSIKRINYEFPSLNCVIINQKANLKLAARAVVENKLMYQGTSAYLNASFILIHENVLKNFLKLAETHYQVYSTSNPVYRNLVVKNNYHFNNAVSFLEKAKIENLDNYYFNLKEKKINFKPVIVDDLKFLVENYNSSSIFLFVSSFSFNSDVLGLLRKFHYNNLVVYDNNKNLYKQLTNKVEVEYCHYNSKSLFINHPIQYGYSKEMGNFSYGLKDLSSFFYRKKIF